MSTVTIHGAPISTYVRTARMVCEEKGVDYELDPVSLGESRDRGLHPFNRIPSFSHGDFHLFECSAIARYVDSVFEGPALQPEDAKTRAIMDQWVSAIREPIYPTMVRQYVIPYYMSQQTGEEPDRTEIEAALPVMEEQFAALEKALDPGPYLAGAQLTLADLFLAPILFYVSIMPEGGDMLTKSPRLSAWFDKISARPSFAATMPM